MQRKFALFTFLVLLVLAACSESTAPAEKKEAAKPAEPVTGRFALYQTFSPARAWATDVQPLQVTSIALDQVKPQPGKSGAWQAVFFSPSKGKTRSWTYSVVEAEGNLHQGVFAGLEEGYSASSQRKPFLIVALKVDSDQAYEAAAKKAGDYMKKNPDKPITYLLELTPKFPDPTWRVIWGQSVGTSNFSIFVDANTGNYLQTMH